MASNKKLANKKKYTKNKPNRLPDLLGSLILISYGFVTVFTPNLRTFDSNGPKFLSMAILNLVVLVIILTNKKYENQYLSFFRNWVGIAYSIMIALSLVSFIKAININESILHFAKIFTTFTAAWLVSVIVSNDRKTLLPLALGMSALLVFDSITVFSEISKYIKGEVKNIGLIKSVYSNKNILASSIFVKIPFSLWLLYFYKGWKKTFGGVVTFLAVLAVFFMSSRAFYLGLIAIGIVLIIYALIRFKQKKDKNIFKIVGVYLGIFLGTLIIFSLIQQNLYPDSNKSTKSVTSRLSTITKVENNSNRLRLTAWKRSLVMIQKDPILGVGLGNWKVRVLEYENKESKNYTYMYKNHNDFLEIAVETGIFGGLSFIAIFILSFIFFIRVLLKNPDSEYLKWYFLPVFGLIAYFFDAFFNFPQDRPEIQALFAIFVGTVVGIRNNWKADQKDVKLFEEKSALKYPVPIFWGIIILGSIYILTLNFNSLKLQRIVKEETMRKKLNSPSEKFINGFPPIPNLTVVAEPIAVQKARYLINEKKYEKAREILRPDNSSPWDARKEYFIAMSFIKEKNYDSALYYAKKVYDIKPRFYNNITVMASSYEKLGHRDSSLILWEEFLTHTKNKKEAWRIAAVINDRNGKIDKAKSYIDEAITYFPNDSVLNSLHTSINAKAAIGDNMPLYNNAVNAYQTKNYKKAVDLFNQFIDKVPNYARAYELRAFSNYFIRNYRECINDVNMIEKLEKVIKSNVINLRGVCYYNIGERDKACEDFQVAKSRGDKDGTTNYQKFCANK